MLDTMVSVIISLFTIFLYTALGIYVLKKNPHERTNLIFVLLMLAFIIWSVGTYNIGLVAENSTLKDALVYTKLQLSGVILALTLFVFFALSLTTMEKVFKNPVSYLTIIPAAYLLNLIWTSDASGLEPGMFSAMKERKQEFFMISGILGMAGVYLLLRHYTASKYKQRGQAEIITTGAISAILVAVVSNIILPMYANVYFLPLSTIAPAVMGIFFAYAVYQYGFFITPVPEVSATSFCGVECALCSQYTNDNCPGCRFDTEKYLNCDAYRCLIKKGYRDCGECPEILECLPRKETSERCFTELDSSSTKPTCELNPGTTHYVKENGYDLFLDAVKCGAFGFVLSTMRPDQIKEKYGLSTTPMIWISDDAFDTGVKPDDLKRLSKLIINFMKKTDKAVVFLDGIDMLISINGLDKVQPVIEILNSAAQATNNRLIISTTMEDEKLSRLKPLFFKRRNTHHRTGKTA